MTANDPLRVLVNLTWLVPGVVGGSEESTTDSLRALLDHDPAVELVLAAHPDLVAAHRDLGSACRVETMPGQGPGRGAALPAKAVRVLGEQTWLAWLTRRVGADVVHHAGGVLPFVHPRATVLTIHDLQPLDAPANFSAAKRWYSKLMLGRSARNADVVCAPSDFTAARIGSLLGVPREEVEVVPWSVVSRPSRGSAGTVVGHTTDPDNAAGTDRPPSDQPLFVYPAITYPHKNHLVLLDAFEMVLQDLPGARLVLPGARGPMEAEVLGRCSTGALAGHVERPGRLDGAAMGRLYRDCTAVVVPSTYEGFGLPALEAMRAGVPLLVAAAGSLPEVVTVDGGSATAVDPIDPGDRRAWAAAMVALARMGPGRRGEVLGAQRAAADRFDAARTASALGAAYRRALRAHLSSGR